MTVSRSEHLTDSLTKLRAETRAMNARLIDAELMDQLSRRAVDASINGEHLVISKRDFLRVFLPDTDAKLGPILAGLELTAPTTTSKPAPATAKQPARRAAVSHAKRHDESYQDAGVRAVRDLSRLTPDSPRFSTIAIRAYLGLPTTVGNTLSAALADARRAGRLVRAVDSNHGGNFVYSLPA